MNKRTKIAIPTDDGHVIGRKFGCSRGFMVATIKSGRIVHKELRWNLLSEMMTSIHGSYYNLCDCDAVIVNEIGECQCQRLKAKKKDVIKTLETEIPQAFINYLSGIPIFLQII